MTHHRGRWIRLLGYLAMVAAVSVSMTTGATATASSGGRTTAALAGPAWPSMLAPSTEAPFDVPGQITDRAGVLGGALRDLEARLAQLREDEGVQLFVVYVDSFGGTSGQTWARRTFAASGMGGDDLLLAVAVQDRRYGTWTTGEAGISPDEDAVVRAQYIEPELAQNDWRGAVVAAAEGYGRAASGGGDGSATDARGDDMSGTSGVVIGGVPWLLLLLPLGAFALFALLRRAGSSSLRGPAGHRPPEQQVSTEELRRRAAGLVVDLDDAVRSSAEELAFAEAQFGMQATQRFKTTLEQARAKADEAFALHLELDDAVATGRLDEQSVRTRLGRIITLATEADRMLEEQEAEFVRLRDLQTTVPRFLVELRGRLGEVRGRIPTAEQELAGLAAQYPAESLATVSGNVAQAQQLLSAAERFIDDGEEHLRAADDRPAAVAAARAAEEAVGQADDLLTSVGRARRELAEAAERIDQALASISADVADAERLGAADELSTRALAAARHAITNGMAARDGGDPLAALRGLTRAERDLDIALVRYREDEERVRRSRRLVERRLREVRDRLDSIDDHINSRRGAVGTQARTCLADARRLLAQAVRLLADDMDAAAELLDRAEVEGERALQLAQEDLDHWNGSRGGPVAWTRQHCFWAAFSAVRWAGASAVAEAAGGVVPPVGSAEAEGSAEVAAASEEVAASDRLQEYDALRHQHPAPQDRRSRTAGRTERNRA